MAGLKNPGQSLSHLDQSVALRDCGCDLTP
jgi:hypothetical protein